MLLTLQVYRSSCTTVNRAVSQMWSNQILLFNANPAISPRSFWSEFNLNVFITFNVIIITWWLRTNHYVIDWILILNAFYTSKCSFLKCFKSAKIAASQKTLGSPSSFPILPPFSFVNRFVPVWDLIPSQVFGPGPTCFINVWLGQGMLYLFPIGWMTAAHATWSYDVIMADHVDGHLIVGLFHFIL